jgi:hypothetical protein
MNQTESGPAKKSRGRATLTAEQKHQRAELVAFDAKCTAELFALYKKWEVERKPPAADAEQTEWDAFEAKLKEEYDALVAKHRSELAVLDAKWAAIEKANRARERLASYVSMDSTW